MNTKKKIGPLKDAIDEVTNMQKRLGRSTRKQVRQEVSKNFQRCVEVIQEREQEILAQVNQIHHMKKKTLEIQAEELELMLGNLNSSIDFTEKVLKHGNEAEVMMVRKQMSQRLQDLNDVKLEYEPLEDEVIDYTFSTDEFRKAIESSGSVKTYHAHPPNCFTNGMGVQRAKAGLEAVFVVVAQRSYERTLQWHGGAPECLPLSHPRGDPVEGKFCLLLGCYAKISSGLFFSRIYRVNMQKTSNWIRGPLELLNMISRSATQKETWTRTRIC